MEGKFRQIVLEQRNRAKAFSLVGRVMQSEQVKSPNMHEDHRLLSEITAVAVGSLLPSRPAAPRADPEPACQGCCNRAALDGPVLAKYGLSIAPDRILSEPGDRAVFAFSLDDGTHGVTTLWP